MRNVLVGLTRYKEKIRMTGLMGNLYFGLSFFNKKQSIDPSLPKKVNYETSQTMISKEAIQPRISAILKNYQQYFTEQRHNLPQFLQRLSKVLNDETFTDHQDKIQEIYNKINKFGSQLVLKPIQYLEILIFIEKYLHLSYKHSFQRLNNNGFQHRATMMAAGFVQDGSLTITQAIAFYKIFKSIGSISILFLANLTKFLKFQFQNENSKKDIKLQHILTILNPYFLKNNRTILQNVLYDMTLNHLLTNPSIIQGASFSMQVELLTYLLQIDLKYFYMSEQRELTNCVMTLTDKILPFRYRKQITILHQLYLLQSCDFFLDSKNNNFQIVTCVMKIINAISKRNERRLQSSAFLKRSDNFQALCRLIYNKRVLLATGDTFKKTIIQNMFEKDGIYPLIDRFYDSNQRHSIELIKQICRQKPSKRRQRIIKVILNISIPQQIITYWEQFVEYSKYELENHLFVYSLLIYSQRKVPLLQHHQQIGKFKEKLRQSIAKLASNNFQFIQSLFETITLHRDINSCSDWLLQIISNIKFHNCLQISRCTQLQRDNHQVRLISITALALSYHSSLTIPHKFKEHNIYTYLLTLYPLDHPSQSYSKSIHFLQSDASFKQNIEIVIRLAERFEKYSYLLWDIFINNYAQRSKAVRESCFSMLRSLFTRAFDKQASRRVVLLSNLTNYMCSHIIIAKKQEIKSLFQSLLQPLVNEQIHQRFHYHCFLQITYNTLSLDILSKETFTKIIKRCLAADESFPASYKTSSLLLLYGMAMKTRSDNIYLLFYEQQRNYLKYLLENKMIKVLKSGNGNDQPQKTNRRIVIAGSKFLSILLHYGQPQILTISPQIYTFIRETPYFTEFSQLCNSFKPQLYDLKNKNLLQFAKSLNQIFEEKIDWFYIMKIISKDIHSEQKKKLSVKSNAIELFRQ